MRNVTRNGFSLLEIMMALAVGAISMSAIIGGLSFTMKQRKIANQPMETSLLFDRVNNLIVQPDRCNTALANGINTVNPATPVPLVINGPSGVDLAQGVSLGNGFRIASFKISVNPGAAVPLAGAVRYPAYVQMQTSQVIDGQTILSNVRTIPLHVIVNSATNVITKCNTDVSDQVTCTEMGGTWDPTAPAGFTCSPKSYCVYGGAFSSYDSDYAGFKNIMTNAYSCPPGYNQQKGGMLDIALKSGKYGVKNRTYPIFNCVRCGSDLAQVNVTPTPSDGTLASVPFCDASGCTTMNQDAAAACNSEYNRGSALSTLGSYFGNSGSSWAPPSGPNDCPP